MKKTFLLAKFIILLSFVGYGQNLQNNNWIYGNDVLGLNFNSTTLTTFSFPAIASQPDSEYLEGCATLSDQNGNLLLFSNGKKLWQKQSNGSTLISNELKGHYSSTQNVIFIPKPGNPNRYFVVTINGDTSDYLGLYYSEVDVVTSTLIAPVNRTLYTGTYYDQDFNQYPNEPIDISYENQSQSITSYPHSNGKDYWLLAYVQNNSSGVLLSYKVTCNGIALGKPEKSKAFKLPSGIAHTLKISPNGNRIAFSTQYSVHYGSFNNSTGEMNLNNTLNSSNSTFTGGYGVEFSPNSNVLFYSQGANMVAKDLTTNNSTIIPTDNYNDVEVGIQLARNGKIYVADDTIKVINNPNDINNLQINSTGLNCGLNQCLPQWVYWQSSTSTNLSAQNDIFNFNSCVTSTSSQSVLQANPTLPDTYNGNPITSLSNHTLSVVGYPSPIPTSGGITLNTNSGQITVLSGTPSGVYKIKYRICEINSCPNCSNDTEVTVNVTNTNGITPTFSFTYPTTICSGNSVPELPTSSNEGITGTWSPSVINNTSTANYTFTPASGLCASQVILTVNITPRIVPTFDFSTSLCYGETAPTLPTSSNNGIVGTWSPSIVSNISSGNYTFSPSYKGCYSQFTIFITVNNRIVPNFTINTTLCSGNTAPILPTISNNGVSGTWYPSIINNVTSGDYTFTPNAGQCASPRAKTISITIINCTPLPAIGCINFDPTNNPTNLNENYAYVNYGQNTVTNLVTFKWYFKFDDGELRILNGQNPIFDIYCIDNPVRSFALMISNDINTAKYYSGPDTGPYTIPGFSGQFRTCFLHHDCNPIGNDNIKYGKTTSEVFLNPIKLFPNPTNSILKFQGVNLHKFSIIIFDISGKEVVRNDKMDSEINIEKLDVGFYIYRISNNKDVIQEGKIIKN